MITKDIISDLDAVFLVNLKFNGESVAVPAKASLDVVTPLVGVPGHNILDEKEEIVSSAMYIFKKKKVKSNLDGAGKQVAVVRKASGKGRSIIESVPWPSL